jgi:phosphatidylserine decarboxylase
MIKSCPKKTLLIECASQTGYFAFGGSTIVCLFQPNTVKLDEDLVRNGEKCIETLVSETLIS